MNPQYPRVRKALDAMNALGVSDEEVEPKLKDLLRVYKNWKYIEDDNYRTLIDAYFESKEAKVCNRHLLVCIFKNRLDQLFFQV